MGPPEQETASNNRNNIAETLQFPCPRRALTFLGKVRRWLMLPPALGKAFRMSFHPSSFDQGADVVLQLKAACVGDFVCGFEYLNSPRQAFR
jgi:hypothetical protein